MSMTLPAGVDAAPASVPDRDVEPIWERPHLPRWIGFINRASCRLGGAGRPRLDPDAMIARARRKTGLDDFGPEDYREGLDALVGSFRAWGGVHPFGRWVFREQCVDILANRLLIQRERTRHPEIADIPVPAPVFIVGPPRSGTTLLQRLMSCDPAGRPLLYWEATWPAPAPDPATYHADRRIKRARRQLAAVDRIAPGIAPGHEMGATLPEEDNSLFAHRFEAAFFGFEYDVPAYVAWLRTRDRTPGYRFARLQLQLLSRKVAGRHWVLKAPTHLYGLESLLAVFPDARVIMTHRDPEKVVPSVCRLAAAFRGMLVDRVDLRRLGAEFNEAVALGADRAIEARAGLDPARFLDVAYADLLADPIAALRRISSHFGLDFSTGFEAAARAHLREHPQGRRGAHRYGLADFGLDRAAIHQAFAPYRAWAAERGIDAGGPPA